MSENQNFPTTFGEMSPGQV